MRRLLLAVSLVVGCQAWAGPAELCRRAKNLAAGRYARCRQMAVAILVTSGDQARYATALVKCRTTFSTKWSRAEAQAIASGGSCVVVNDRDVIGPTVDGETTRIADALAGGGLTDCSSGLATCQSDLGTCLAGCTEGGALLATEQRCHLVCAPGEDSQTMAGLPRSYRDNGDGTLSDLQTGLTWERLSDDGSVHDVDTTYDWASAFSKIAALNTPPCFTFHCDWRLPNATEALSIASYDSTSSGVAAVFDQGCAVGCAGTACSCAAAFYWTSTSRYIDGTNAWLFGSDVGALYFEGKTTPHGVRAVRGGL